MQNTTGKTALDLDLNLGSLICYLNICLPFGLIYSILVIVQDKTNKLPRFHAFQSLFLLIASIVVIVPLYVVMIIGVFVDAMIGLPLISGLVGLAIFVYVIGMLIFTILAAVKGYGGQMYKIPVVGNFAEKYANQ